MQMELTRKTSIYRVIKEIFPYAKAMSLALVEPFRSFQIKKRMAATIGFYFDPLRVLKIKKMGVNIENSGKQTKLTFYKKSFQITNDEITKIS